MDIKPDDLVDDINLDGISTDTKYDLLGDNRDSVGKFLVIFIDKLTNMFINLFNKIIDVGVKQINLSHKNNKKYEKYKYSTVFNYIYIRYFITILIPPLGVFMSKGLYGFINILVCIFFCYINYVLGIIYSLILTYNSKHGDEFDRLEKEVIHKIKLNNKNDNINEGKGELFVMFLFLLLFVGLFVLVLYLK